MGRREGIKAGIARKPRSKQMFKSNSTMCVTETRRFDKVCDRYRERTNRAGKQVARIPYGIHVSGNSTYTNNKI